MSKSMVALVVVALAVALGAVAAIAIRLNGGNKADVPAAQAPAQTEETQVATASAAQPEPAKPAVAAVVPQQSAGTSASTAAEARPAEPTANLETLVNSLTPDQQDKLYKSVRKREHERQAALWKYMLPSEQQLRGMAYMMPAGTKEPIKLTDTQTKQIDSIKDGLKPKMDVMLADLWARSDELNKRMMETWSKASKARNDPSFQQEIQQLGNEQRQLREKIDQVKDQVDQEFSAAARSVLTAEQIQSLDDAIAQQKKWMEDMKKQSGAFNVGGGGAGFATPGGR